MRQHLDIYSELAKRVGEDHLRQRLVLQVEHAAQVFGQGRTLLHIENVEWLPVAIYRTLRLVGLYALGQRNARALEVQTNIVAIEELPSALDGMRLLHLSDLHLDLDPGVHRIFQVRGPQKNAAVGAFGDLEFQLENEVTVLLFGPEIIVIMFSAIKLSFQLNLSVHDFPRFVRAHHPLVEILTVKKSDETLRSLFLSHSCMPRNP